MESINQCQHTSQGRWAPLLYLIPALGPCWALEIVTRGLVRKLVAVGVERTLARCIPETIGLAGFFVFMGICLYKCAQLAWHCWFLSYDYSLDGSVLRARDPILRRTLSVRLDAVTAVRLFELPKAKASQKTVRGYLLDTGRERLKVPEDVAERMGLLSLCANANPR